VVTRCATSPDASGTPGCRLDLRGTRELRITVVTTRETGISAIRLY
jgi:hypothetical protein